MVGPQDALRHWDLVSQKRPSLGKQVRFSTSF